MNLTEQAIRAGRFGQPIMEYRGMWITDRPYQNTPFTLVADTPKGPQVVDHCDELTLHEMTSTVDVLRDEAGEEEREQYPLPRWRMAEGKEYAKQAQEKGIYREACNLAEAYFTEITPAPGTYAAMRKAVNHAYRTAHTAWFEPIPPADEAA